ncbi:DUF4097 family beta strand repeat-containing protein [Leeuwenhoekiella polynyae]|uniref:Adhesin domain-containing protein n=1 Tax=Leeuwenhoekiella polynyae TaxID=1550906 RepID=A0A4Q0P0D3_9FLAO|nr:hypothetical protein [Leeuwenhoekiella polynyae]RXG17072.1 hypothetical protein DSM02_3170 [Leeuwenhoekiella polynyae]
MRIIVNFYVTLLAAVCVIPQGIAQTKTTKLDERFSTSSDAAIIADTQYADVVFDDWNKNEVAVEAVIESEDLSKEEIEQLLESWQISVQGNSSGVRIISRGAPAAVTVALGNTQMRGVNDLISSSMQMMKPVMQNMISPMLEQFSSMQLPAEYYKGMNAISFDYQAYKRDGTKYLEQYKRKVEQTFGEDFDVVMKKWEQNNKKKVAAGQGIAGSSLLGMPRSPFGKEMSFDSAQYNKNKKAYVAAMNKKYGTNVNLNQVEKWRKDIEDWGDDFGDDMKAWGERFGKQFGGSAEALGANFGRALESDMAAMGQNVGKAMQGWSNDFAQKLQQMAEEQGGSLKKTVTRDANGNVSTQMTYSFSGDSPAVTASKPKGSYKRKIIVHMPKEARLDLNVRHGNIQIESATNARVNLAHGDFIAETISGDKTLINVAYSPVDVASWDYGTLRASYLKNCVIEKAKSINIDSRASSIVIKELEDTAVITGSFGELSIPKLGKNFKTLNISVENSDVVLNLPETPFHFNFNGVRSRLNYPKSLDAKVMEGYNSSMVNGFYKSRNTDSIIAISSKYSDIALN